MGAHRFQGIDLLLALEVAIHDPHAVLSDVLGFDLPLGKAVLEPHLELARRLGKHVGKHESSQPQREQAARHREGRETHGHRRTEGDLHEPAAIFPLVGRLLGGLDRLGRERGHGAGWRCLVLDRLDRLPRLRGRPRRRIGLAHRPGLRRGPRGSEDAGGVPLHAGLSAARRDGRLGRRLGSGRCGRRRSSLGDRSGVGGRLFAGCLLRSGLGENVRHAGTSTTGRRLGRCGLGLRGSLGLRDRRRCWRTFGRQRFLRTTGSTRNRGSGRGLTFAIR